MTNKIIKEFREKFCKGDFGWYYYPDGTRQPKLDFDLAKQYFLKALASQKSALIKKHKEELKGQLEQGTTMCHSYCEQEKADLLREISIKNEEFRKEVKRLENIKSPILMLDTSKNFIIWLKDKL